MSELMEMLLTPAAQVALIIGLAELCKKVGVPTRWIPVIDLVLGLISGICVYGLMLDYTVAYGAIAGVALGLSACGLFSGIKNVAGIGGKEDGEGTD